MTNRPNDLDDLLDFHAENFFATTCFFGEELILAPRSDWGKAIPVVAVSIGDSPNGSNENRGDGVRLNRGNGSSDRQSILVEFENSVPIQQRQSRQNPDQIKWNDQIWSAIRIVGFDQSMKTVLFVSTVDKISSGQSRRG